MSTVAVHTPFAASLVLQDPAPHTILDGEMPQLTLFEPPRQPRPRHVASRSNLEGGTGFDFHGLFPKSNWPGTWSSQGRQLYRAQKSQPRRRLRRKLPKGGPKQVRLDLLEGQVRDQEERIQTLEKETSGREGTEHVGEGDVKEGPVRIGLATPRRERGKKK